MIDSPIAAFWWAFLVAAMVAYPVYATLLKTKSRQTVSEFAPEGHQLKQGTPTMGGLIIVIAILAVCVVALFSSSAWGSDSWWPAALLLTAGFAAIGFIDDFVVPRMMKGKRGLGWKQKIVMQLVVALGASALTYGGINLNSLVMTFLILFFSNAYNFADGLDGLAGTLLLGLAGGLFVLAGLLDRGVTTVPLMVALCGAVLPFLFLNAPPAKVFMGDVGSLPIGALLGGAVSVLFLNPAPRMADGQTWKLILSLVLLSLVMVAELVPPPLQIFWVKVFKKRLFPYTPIHHAFEKAGWKETRVVAMFALVQLVLAVLAISIVVS